MKVIFLNESLFLKLPTALPCDLVLWWREYQWEQGFEDQLYLKGLVHPEIQVLILFTRPHVVQNLHEFISSV